jgi:shikimate kinase
MDPALRTHIALIGLMGAGKSRVGSVLAGLLGRRFRDADRELEAAAGRTVAEIFRTEGESGFRDRETTVLRGLVAGPESSVIALGGGVVERPENRDLLLPACTVVWLRVNPREAARRLAGKTDRPLLGEDPLAALLDLAARRAPHYLAWATVVETTGETDRPETVAARIRNRLHAASSR